VEQTAVSLVPPTEHGPGIQDGTMDWTQINEPPDKIWRGEKGESRYQIVQVGETEFRLSIQSNGEQVFLATAATLDAAKTLAVAAI
jgi:hypothetical protein